MTEMMELNLNDMAMVSGGKDEGGYEKKPPKKEGCHRYQIKRGDTLGSIARAHGTTVKKILKVNPEIKNENLIIIGCWIYIPA